MPRKLRRIECSQCHKTFKARWKGKFCSRECYVQNLKETRPRGPRPVVACKNCGEAFKQMGPNHLYCSSEICHAIEHHRRWAPFYRQQRERHEDRQRRRLQNQLAALLDAADGFGSSSWREQRQREARERLATALAENPELRELVDAQERDQRWSTYAGLRWERSLNAPYGEDATLLEFLAGDVNESEANDTPSFSYLRHGRQILGWDQWVDVVIARLDRKREIDAAADDYESSRAA